MQIFERAKRHYNLQLPFVLFVKPNGNKVNAYFQNNSKLYSFDNQNGFVFSSFDAKTQLIFPEDYSEKCSESLQIEAKETPHQFYIQTSKQEQICFQKLVQKSVDVIKNGAFDKLVVSRKIEFSDSLDIFETYSNLVSQYANTFRYLLFHPKIGVWLGASPEQFIKINTQNFQTVSLAATQLYSNNIQWAAKEIQEQQFVTDFLVSTCQSLASNITISAPTTIQAGPLAHIKTIISGTIENHKKKLLISQLHPTPAVCGLPKEKAQAFLIENENYDRKFYSGFLGEWHQEQSVDLFVNLRCLEIGVVNTIYVGCGITKDSIPEKEFIETENKSITIKNILVVKSL
ncbi:MAG TPA: isochorismate synthase [Flavobacterium sp.]|nr:isochorismate synthase [Flavobacterium sp.]